MKEKTKFEFTIENPDIEDLFLRYVGYERTTVDRVVNTAILLYLSKQVGLNREERKLIRQMADLAHKRWVTAS